MKTKLSQLRPKESGVIISHLSNGAIRQRLLDLGLIPGVEINFIRNAPMGDPVEVRVNNTHVVVRKTEAETVIVESSISCQAKDSKHEKK